MTQRTTGATPEQIERAARDAWNCGLEPDDTRFDDAANKDQYPTRQNAKWWAGNLVRPDERIVSVAELRAVMELAMTSAWAADNYEAIDRITALIGDDA